MLTLDISSHISPHAVAQWLIATIRHLFDLLGLKHDPNVEGILYIIVVTGVAILLGWLIRRAVLAAVRKIVALSHTDLGAELLRARVFTQCSHVIPPLVMFSLVPFSVMPETTLHTVVMKLLFVYLMLTVTLAVNSIIKFTWERYDSHENTRNLPLKGIANTMRGVVWIITVIITVSVLIGKSPAMLLTGLGAFAAALMLVFKDSILGLVASIQLSQNDMVRIGDWIVVPGTPANGVVMDMTLSTVKVRNFDNTIVTCPPYTLVQQSFQNWRGMQESGARRVSYDMTVDNSTIHTLSPAELEALVKAFPELAEWVSAAQAAPGGQLYAGGIMAVNGTTETNLGLFRALLSGYLTRHPRVAKGQQMLVRIQPPTEQGTTLNVYCFTDTTEWTLYEAILSQIMEYVAATAPAFGLRLFTPATGHIPGGEALVKG